MLPREGWVGQRHDQTPAALLIARYLELGGSEAVYLDRSETPSMRHWTAYHFLAPDTQLTVDPLGQPVVSGPRPSGHTHGTWRSGRCAWHLGARGRAGRVQSTC